MAKVLLVASADSPLLIDRVRMSMTGEDEVFWYTESGIRPEADCPVYHYRKIAGLGPVNKLLSTFYFFYVYWRIRPDILHVHWALFMPLLFRRCWRNLIVSVMGSDVNLPGRFRSRRFFARAAFSRAKVITSKSLGMDDAITKLGDYKAKIRRFTWGVSEDLFVAKPRRNEIRKSLGIPEDALVIFSPRAVQPLYRIPDIARAFVDCTEGQDNLYLLMAEMNPHPDVKEELDKVFFESGAANRVIRLGRLDKEGMINCYAAADVVVSYAKHDGMPQSLYEALAVGCFPVFTDLPCYHEVLQHQDNALLSDSCERSSLAYSLKQYQQHYHGAVADRIVAKNRELVRQLASRSGEEKRLIAMYEQMCCGTSESGNVE